MLADAYVDRWLETSCRCKAHQWTWQKKESTTPPGEREQSDSFVTFWCLFWRLWELIKAEAANHMENHYGFLYAELSNPIRHQLVGFVDSKTFRKLLQSTQSKDRLIFVCLYKPLNPHSSQLQKDTYSNYATEIHTVYILFPCKHIS